MKLDEQELSEIELLLGGLEQTKEAALMKKYIQHGQISTYDHVISVVRLSFYLNRRFHLGASEAELVRGAFLKTAISGAFTGCTIPGSPFRTLRSVMISPRPSAISSRAICGR